MDFVFDIEFHLRTPLPARCFKFENSVDLAWHNNMYRTYCLAPSTLENEVSAIVGVHLIASVSLTAGWRLNGTGCRALRISDFRRTTKSPRWRRGSPKSLMSGGTSKEVKWRGRDGECCTSPSMGSEVKGACIRCPLSISSVTADSRIGLKLFGQIPYNRSIAQFFFHLSAERGPTGRGVGLRSRVCGQLQMGVRRKETLDRGFTSDGGTDLETLSCVWDTETTWERCTTSSRPTHTPHTSTPSIRSDAFRAVATNAAPTRGP